MDIIGGFLIAAVLGSVLLAIISAPFRLLFKYTIEKPREDRIQSEKDNRNRYLYGAVQDFYAYTRSLEVDRTRVAKLSMSEQDYMIWYRKFYADRNTYLNQLEKLRTEKREQIKDVDEIVAWEKDYFAKETQKYPAAIKSFGKLNR